MEAEQKSKKSKRFFGTQSIKNWPRPEKKLAQAGKKKNWPRPDAIGPNDSGWYGRLRGPILPLSQINSDQL